jgi:inosose dehydratase
MSEPQSRLGVRERLAGAPISWGVCEAPGWGIELPADRVLAEMTALGITATELGPTGYLGAQPADVQSRLAATGMRLIGGFLPVPMHVDPALDLGGARAAMRVLAAGGSEVVVLAAQSGDGSYDHKVVMDDTEWETLLSTLKRLTEAATEEGLRTTLHPHVGTAIESRDAVLQLIERSDVPICLDTGHLVIGGTDPFELVSQYADRVAHVHLKDVRLDVARTVSGGDTDYLGAVRKGLYAPLGQGDLDIAGIVRALEGAGYDGWYVLEQDVALGDVPPEGHGPVDEVRASIAFLDEVAGSLV